MKRIIFFLVPLLIVLESARAASILNGQLVEVGRQVFDRLLVFVVAHASDALFYATLAVPLLAFDAMGGTSYVLAALFSSLPWHDSAHLPQ